MKMNAGESVIREMLSAVESAGDATTVLEKFSNRYPRDVELLKACGLYAQFLTSREPKKLDEAKARLRALLASRAIELSGGADINLKDRRKLKPDSI